jgi:hypothetical protein
MKILHQLEGKTYHDLEGEYDKYRVAFDNMTVRTVIVKNWPDKEYLHAMFHRLNTGTLPLSSQELRQALFPGKFLDYLDEATGESKAFMSILKNKNPDPRMKDVELALRSFAWKYFGCQYSGKYKVFLDDTCKKLNDRWADEQISIKLRFKSIEEAILFSLELFENQPFSKPKPNRYSFNRAIYDTIVFYLSIKEVRDVIINSNLESEFRTKYNELFKDEMFVRSISESFAAKDNVQYRFNKIHELIVSVTNLNIPRMEFAIKSID